MTAVERICRFRLGLGALATGLLLTCALPVWAGAPTASEKRYEVQIIKDVPYYTGPGMNKTRHKLDLYLPKGARDFPVLFFVHGGAWMMGDKDLFGLHHPIGIFFARHGIGVVMTNYRLSPQVHFPVHEEDVARAFAWTVQNIGKYHGRADQIFALGHSAGGQIVALLGTDESYLKARGLSFRNLKGVICCSGVYEIPADNSFFDKSFTTDPKLRRRASPLDCIKEGDPPFLLFCADHDLPFCGKPYAEKFCEALQAKHIPAELHEIAHRTHNSCFLSAHYENDPVARTILEFVRVHTADKSAVKASP
ncbi:MAG TPA: alpha/beta hydrolase [Gemmataceae bacterium]|nr:alpha/beta hydrolase [Gemmataceae bacterium]